MNIIPFYYDNDVGRLHVQETVLNVLVFVPFGLYLKMLDVSSKRIILYGFLFSFALELIQFILAIGASDITDIITNTTGTALGVCLYALARKVFADKTITDRIINVIASVAVIFFVSLAVLLFFAN